MKNKFSFSICVPIYKASNLLGDMLDSIFAQEDFDDYEIIIGDNNSPDMVDEIKKTQEIINSYNDPRIRYYKNEKDLGYAVNLQRIVSRAENDVIFLMAHDDILAKDAFKRTHDAFLLDENVGVVTRPYFWFEKDYHNPVRAVLPYDDKKDSVLSLESGRKAFLKIFESVGQLSGLAYRREFLEVPFNDECFPAHIYPFAGILRKHKCVFLKDYTVAVGIADSQTRTVSSTYDMSPTDSWLRMYRSVFKGDEYNMARRWGEDHILTNFMGLVQLKNYANPGVLRREIGILVKERKKNLLDLKFWFFVLGTVLTPKFVLIPLVDWYKSKVNSKLLVDISFNR
ncbi:glycosyltransferase family 2 protein [Patescibacteria group bacterium]